MVVAEGLFGQKGRKVAYHSTATAIFSHPPMATVGQTEAQLQESGKGSYDVYESQFRALRYTLGNLKEITYLKLIVERSSARVIACHMLGKDAPEIMQAVAIAIHAGVTKSLFDETIGIHWAFFNFTDRVLSA